MIVWNFMYFKFILNCKHLCYIIFILWFYNYFGTKTNGFKIHTKFKFAQFRHTLPELYLDECFGCFVERLICKNEWFLNISMLSLLDAIKIMICGKIRNKGMYNWFFGSHTVAECVYGKVHIPCAWVLMWFHEALSVVGLQCQGWVAQDWDAAAGTACCYRDARAAS